MCRVGSSVSRDVQTSLSTETFSSARGTPRHYQAIRETVQEKTCLNHLNWLILMYSSSGSNSSSSRVTKLTTIWLRYQINLHKTLFQPLVCSILSSFGYDPRVVVICKGRNRDWPVDWVLSLHCTHFSLQQIDPRTAFLHPSSSKSYPLGPKFTQNPPKTIVSDSEGLFFISVT